MSPPTTVMAVPMLLGDAARACGVAAWKLRAAIKRGFLGEPYRLGPSRIFFPDQLDQVREALRAAGYLPPEGERAD